MRMHIAVNVTDLDANLKFYRAFFGAEPTKAKHNYAKFELNNPPVHFSMNVRPHEKLGVLDHLGFQVENTEAVHEWRQRLKQAGLVTLDEMNTTCCYAVQDKIWIRDPEGNAWEIFYTKEDSEFESAGESVMGSVCCVPPATDFIELELGNMADKKKIIYFLCTGNSCRSQMAEGWGKHFGNDNVEVYSAGIETHGLNPRAVAAMEEAGIDISSQTSDLINPEILNKADYVVTLCGDANDKCPITPPYVKRLHWGFEDPAKVTGTEEEVMASFHEVRDSIRDRIRAFYDQIQL